MTTRFDRDTAFTPVGPGRFEGRIDAGWWVEIGPNGGYIAALVLRGLVLAVDDATRSPRSLTVQFLAPPAEGPVVMETTLERVGRQFTFVSGRLRQGERLIATAMCAFAVPLTGIEFSERTMPRVPGAHEIDRWDPVGAPPIRLRDRYDQRWALGAAPWSGGDSARSGGWIRLMEPRPIDHLLITALSDAWVPPVFSRITEEMAVPTIDLTVHFRADLPLAGMSETDFCLTVFWSKSASGGFIEEDGEIWSPDGVLLAQSRQLAVTR